MLGTSALELLKARVFSSLFLFLVTINENVCNCNATSLLSYNIPFSIKSGIVVSLLSTSNSIPDSNPENLLSNVSTVIISVWIPPKADPETKTWVQIVYLGGV